MKWIKNYNLFLFDFDGLLVNTEELHCAAYHEMCRARGFDLDWDLNTFFRSAHVSATALKENIYRKFPELHAQEPRWEVLYEEKKAAYQKLLQKGGLKLLPGVSELLEALSAANIPRCVVTNSPKIQVEEIKQQLPLLKTIPHWVTRECYQKPKPDPESYLKGIETAGKGGDKIIGFEDSMRGLKALLGAGVQDALLICPADHPQLEEPIPQGVRHFTSFSRIVDLY
jgi:HAD superfamily hydrolase (TIGR01509 family)